jgi:hypothetical protein
LLFPKTIFIGGGAVADYKTMYHRMFNAATDAERLMEKAVIILKAVQIECEEKYIAADETPITLDADTVNGEEISSGGN